MHHLPSDVRCHHLVDLTRMQELPYVRKLAVRVGKVSYHLPRPFSPEPALFETAVSMLTSLRFARAPIKVSVGKGKELPGR